MLMYFTIFLAALALAWGVGFWAAAKIDVQKTAVPQWMPAFFIANHFVNDAHVKLSMIFIVIGVLCVAAGMLLHNIVSIFLFVPAVAIFGPVAFYICYKIRESALLGAGEYVFFNEVRPPAMNEERDLALYIEDDEWAEIPAATPHYLKFWQEYQVAGGLYICPCEHQVLQAIDSLNLYKYIISPDHPKMLNAFASALSAVNPTTTSQSAYARRTFVRMQTQAQGALSVPKKEKSKKADAESKKPDFSPELPPEIMKMFKHLEEKEKSEGKSSPVDDDDDDDDLDDWEKEFLKELEEEHEKSLQKKPSPPIDEPNTHPEG